MSKVNSILYTFLKEHNQIKKNANIVNDSEQISINKDANLLMISISDLFPRTYRHAGY